MRKAHAAAAPFAIRRAAFQCSSIAAVELLGKRLGFWLAVRGSGFRDVFLLVAVFFPG